MTATGLYKKVAKNKTKKIYVVSSDTLITKYNNYTKAFLIEEKAIDYLHTIISKLNEKHPRHFQFEIAVDTTFGPCILSYYTPSGKRRKNTKPNIIWYIQETELVE